MDYPEYCACKTLIRKLITPAHMSLRSDMHRHLAGYLLRKVCQRPALFFQIEKSGGNRSLR
jgi:hypothetical protein